MGVFGFAEIIAQPRSRQRAATSCSAKVKGLLPTRADLKAVAPADRCAARCSARSSASLPGGGALLASFAAYTVEKKLAQAPRALRQGRHRGRRRRRKSANNAGAQTSFIPLLTLGIPPNAVMALMVGAMTIHGIQPGPAGDDQQPELFWGLIASMWVGNLMLVILNLPLIGIWVKLLTVPYRLLVPGDHRVLLHRRLLAQQHRRFDVLIAAAFGLLGYCAASSSTASRRRCCSASSSGR